MKIGYCIILLSTNFIFADINSTSGNIFFDTDSNNSYEATLNVTGLGIGISPSANLHVDGNAIISSKLSIGPSLGSSNLNLTGTMGFSSKTISSNTTLGDTSYVFVDTSSTNITLTLPSANVCSGRIYTIKRTSFSNNLLLGSSDNIDGCSSILVGNPSSELAYIKVLSTGADWVILNQSAYSSTLSSNLVGWWKFDEASGSTLAMDSSIYKNHGTHTNINSSSNVGVNGVHFGKAVSYDGTDDYTTIPALNLNTNNMTITAWVKLNDNAPLNGNDGIVFCRAGSTVAGLRAATQLQYHWNDQYYGWGSGLTMTAQVWTFVAMVVHPDKVTLYRNLDSATNTAAHVVEAFDGEIRIANHNFSSSFIPATIDEVRIYNRSLGASELREIYDTRP
jgi:hypothetical protein